MTDQNDQTLVDRFANDLRSRIEAGEYGTSGVIPSMSELASAWGTQNRALVADVIMFLRAQGYLTQAPNKRYRVVHPRITLPGLTPNFRQHLEGLGLKAEETDIEAPRVEPMPLDIARMFTRSDTGEPAIREGVHVIHRVRKQGITDLPLRLGHIWYPLDIVGPYLEAMQKDSSFDVPATLKRDRGISVVDTDFIIRSRIPDADEVRELNLAKYQPVLEVRRIGYTEGRGQVITLHRTIMDGTRFEYRLEQSVDYWK